MEQFSDLLLIISDVDLVPNNFIPIIHVGLAPNNFIQICDGNGTAGQSTISPN